MNTNTNTKSNATMTDAIIQIVEALMPILIWVAAYFILPTRYFVVAAIWKVFSRSWADNNADSDEIAEDRKFRWVAFIICTCIVYAYNSYTFKADLHALDMWITGIAKSLGLWG